MWTRELKVSWVGDLFLRSMYFCRCALFSSPHFMEINARLKYLGQSMMIKLSAPLPLGQLQWHRSGAHCGQTSVEIDRDENPNTRIKTLRDNYYQIPSWVAPGAHCLLSWKREICRQPKVSQSLSFWSSQTQFLNLWILFQGQMTIFCNTFILCYFLYQFLGYARVYDYVFHFSFAHLFFREVEGGLAVVAIHFQVMNSYFFSS